MIQHRKTMSFTPGFSTFNAPWPSRGLSPWPSRCAGPSPGRRGSGDSAAGAQAARRAAQCPGEDFVTKQPED